MVIFPCNPQFSSKLSYLYHQCTFEVLIAKSNYIHTCLVWITFKKKKILVKFAQLEVCVLPSNYLLNSECNMVDWISQSRSTGTVLFVYQFQFGRICPMLSFMLIYVNTMRRIKKQNRKITYGVFLTKQEIILNRYKGHKGRRKEFS